MKKLLAILFVLNSCHKTVQSDSKETIEIEDKKNIFESVGIHSYDAMPIPAFFSELIKNHATAFRIVESENFQDFVTLYHLNSEDSFNANAYYNLLFLHEIFTSQNASNCSKGNILNIPYLWHWVNPNPRHEIYSLAEEKLLKEVKPPKEYSKYNSYADIDRTPFLFLSELLSTQQKYYSPSCDTFSTFGWCSEREMAFVCLMELLNYQGKVVAEGNHSWSEFILEMNTVDKQKKYFSVRVDNTFDQVEWNNIDSGEIAAWKRNQGDSPMARWYNQKAHSSIEKERIRNFMVSTIAMSRIEQSSVKYLLTLAGE